MRGEILSFLLFTCGLGCILSWGVCNVLASIRGYRIGREADAMKMHVAQGGRLPDEARRALARHYLHVKWLDILGKVMLAVGVGVLAVVSFVLP